MADAFFIIDARNICRGLYYPEYSFDRKIMNYAAKQGARFEPYYFKSLKK